MTAASVTPGSPATAAGRAGSRLGWANSLRGVAALLVVVAHLGAAHQLGIARSVYPFADDVATAGFAPGGFLLTLPINLGSMGVALFFLVSGLVISRSLAVYSRGGFAVGRVMRILPTFVAAYGAVMALRYLLNGLGGAALPVDPGWLFGGMVPGLHMVTQTPGLGLGIEWTLVVEILFYGVCLVFFRSIASSRLVVLGLAAGCLAVIVLLRQPDFTASGPWLGTVITLIMFATYLPLLLIGVVVARGLTSSALLDIGVLITVFVIGAQLSVPALSSTALTSVLIVIPPFLAAAAWAGGWQSGRIVGFFADISYPLYLVHLMAGAGAMYALGHVIESGTVLFVAGVAVSVALAWLLHVCVEGPSHRIGRAWARRLSADREAPLLPAAGPEQQQAPIELPATRRRVASEGAAT